MFNNTALMYNINNCYIIKDMLQYLIVHITRYPAFAS